ncbi:autotransporter domain-containing protein [Pseudomonas chlororaphis]
MKKPYDKFLSKTKILATIVSNMTILTPAAFAEEIPPKNFSIKLMTFNIWNRHENSKMWAPQEDGVETRKYAEATKNLFHKVSPDIVALPELFNNGQVNYTTSTNAGSDKYIYEFERNTIDTLNESRLKQGGFVKARRNQDEDIGKEKGTGSIFSTVPFVDEPGDSIRITPGNGFPESIVNAIHLDHGDGFNRRLTEAKKLNDAAKASNIPIILLGDFNAGEVSERGLHSKNQQLLVIENAGGSGLYKKLAYEYLGDKELYRPVIQKYYPAKDIDQLLWSNWASALRSDILNSGKKSILQDEKYPVESNRPVTISTLKKQYKIFRLNKNEEKYRPSKAEDERATWPSDGEMSTNIATGWDRATLDHIFVSYPFAKWIEIADDGKLTGNLSKLARDASGKSLSDHEPVAQNLRWIGPSLEVYKEDGESKTRMVWGKDAYDFAGRNKTYYLTRNNERDDVALGQVIDNSGNFVFDELDNEQKKTTLNCKGSDARFKQAVEDLCIDDHSFISEVLVKDNGLLIVDEDEALGGRNAKLLLTNGGLKVAGTSMSSLDRKIVLEQDGWIDIAEPGHEVSANQALMGPGSLTKLGAGTLRFSSANSYTGGTFVEEGILRSDIAGGFVNNTAYTINGGAIDLNGFDLTASRLEGKGGSLQLGTGSLTVDQAEVTHYDGAITGLGGLIKTGSGKLTLNGQNSYTGETLVREGHLGIGDSDHPLARLQSTVTVGEGAKLSGIGTLGDLVIKSGGTIAPGNSIGTLRTGNVTFDAGSVYEVEVGPDGRSDRVDSSGVVTLNGGDIRVSLENHTNLLTADEAKTLVGQTFNILTAEKGIVGQFSSVTPDYLFMNTRITGSRTQQELIPVALDPSGPIATSLSVAIERNSTSFASVAQSENERAVATAIEPLPLGNPVYESLLTFHTAEQARQAFKQLDGQVHADVAAVQVADSRYIRDATNARLQQAQALQPQAKIHGDNSSGGWVQLLGGRTQHESDHNTSSFSSSTTGVLLGLDSDIGDGWRFGGATGYTQTRLEGASKKSVDSDNYHLSVYGGKRFESIALRFGGATTWHHIETSRHVSYGNQSAHPTAAYKARTDQVFGEVGYVAWLGWEPFANMTYVNFQSDSFQENGKGAALRAGKQSQDAIVSTTGLRGHMQLPVGSSRSVRLRGELGWEHQYKELDRTKTMKFVGSDTEFGVSSVPASRDGAVVKASAEMNLTKDTLVSLNYTGQVSGQDSGNALNLGVSFQF